MFPPVIADKWYLVYKFTTMVIDENCTPLLLPKLNFEGAGALRAPF